MLMAPLMLGWVNQCRAWLQNKSAPSLLLPYRMLHKLFNKESVIAEHASPLFRAAPYIVFGCMALASGIVPTLSTDLPLSPVADAIALVGLFALARVFISLAAMDIGPAGRVATLLWDARFSLVTALLADNVAQNYARTDLGNDLFALFLDHWLPRGVCGGDTAAAVFEKPVKAPAMSAAGSPGRS